MFRNIKEYRSTKVGANENMKLSESYGCVFSLSRAELDRYIPLIEVLLAGKQASDLPFPSISRSD